MTVFNGYLKVIRRNSSLILLYMAIFFSCTILMQSMAGKSEKSYRAEALKVGVTDEDGGSLAEALKGYLGNFHEIILLDNDLSLMQEKLFYRDVEYIVRIPENFYKKCVEGEETLKVTAVPGTYSGIYADHQINSFLNNAKTYLAAGFTETEMAAALERTIPVEVMLAGDGSTAERPRYIFYFRYVPYLFLALLGFVAGSILIVFSKRDVKRRMLASPVSAVRQSLEGLFSLVAFGGVLFLIVILAAVGFYGKALYGTGKFGYYLLNTLVMLFVSLSVAYLAGLVASNKDALNGIVNVLSLGMCFLCGTFVPLDYISEEVKAVSQFFPVYWYETANDLLGEFTVLTEQAEIQFFQAVGIQVAFGVALICVTLVIGKFRRVER